MEGRPGRRMSDLVDRFKLNWTHDQVFKDEEILERKDLAFVYVLPKMQQARRPFEVIEWSRLHLHDWMQHFRLHFRPPTGQLDKPIRRFGGSPSDADGESMADSGDPEYWRNLKPWSVNAFEWCFCQMVRLDRAEDVACLLPPIVILAEDHEIDARLAGTNCFLHLIKVSPTLVFRMGLADLLLQILKVNLSFHEHPALLLSTITTLQTLVDAGCTDPSPPGWKAPRFSPPYLSLIDEFFEIVLRSLQLANQENMAGLVGALEVLVEMEQLGAVRFLSSLLQLIVELPPSQSVKQLYCTVKRVCAPRIHRYTSICRVIEEKLDL